MTAIANVPQWMRRCSVLIGTPGTKGILVENLRMTFDIKKTSTSDFNTAKVEIYNLNKDHRLAVNDTDMTVTVQAGYAGNVQTLYVGDITFCLSGIPRPETLLTIEANDGHRTIHQLKFPCSYGPGTSAKQILKDIVAKSGVGHKNVKWSSLPDQKYIHGFAYRGMAKQLVDNLCSYIGLEWSIQDGQLQFLVIGSANTAKVISLNPSTGLIGSPQALQDIGKELLRDTKHSLKVQTHSLRPGQKIKPHRQNEQGLKVEALLIPSAEPGGVIEVESAEYPKSLWRIVEVRHTGDTHGDDWKSTLTLMSFSTSWLPKAGGIQHVEGSGAEAPPDAVDEGVYNEAGVE